MNSKLTKFLPTLFIVVILAIAVWYVGVQTLSIKQPDKNTAQSTGALVYILKESGKVTFYKSALNKINPKPFYALTGDEAKGFYMAWMEKDGIIFQITNPSQTETSEYFHLNLSGERSAIAVSQIIDRTPEGYPMSNLTKKAQSLDGKWLATVESKDPEAPSADVKLIIRGANKTAEIPITKFPHSSVLRTFLPQGFSSDNKSLFVIILETPGDIGATGLYKINLDDEHITELAYDENKGVDYSAAHIASMYLQPSTEFAYYIHGKILTQINTLTEEKVDIYTTIPDEYSLVFPSDEKTIIFNPLPSSKDAIQVFDIQTKTLKILPMVSGGFRAISSDKNYLIYSKYSEEFSNTPFTNVSSIDRENKKIQIMQFYVLDVENNKGVLIFTDKKIPDSLGNLIGLNGKEYSFVGSISPESK